ncbi:hypothetical protein TMRH483_01118 [Qipengyuania sp. 483]
MKYRAAISAANCRNLGVIAKTGQAAFGPILASPQSVLYVDTEIADRVLDLRVTQQDLDRTNVAGSPIDHRGFCPPKRVCSILGLPKSNCGHPFIDEEGILTRAHVPGMIALLGKKQSTVEPQRRSSRARRVVRTSEVSSNCTGRLVFC